MTFNFIATEKCISCPYGNCTSYIREQSKKMKDRNTMYRIGQNKLMSCIFDSGLPGSEGYEKIADLTIDEILNQMVNKAIEAGEATEIHNPNHYGKTEKPFFVSNAQVGKIRGDIAEMLLRAIFWNLSIDINNQLKEFTQGQKSREIAIITTGDNYNLKNLFSNNDSLLIEDLETKLEACGTSLSYSTPDFFVINIENIDQEAKAILQSQIESLSEENQFILNESKKLVEGKLKAEDVLMVFGLKTSIRSDRMYQFLYEANAFKAIWHGAFKKQAPQYISVMTRVFGANYKKLQSVELVSLTKAVPERAIDKIIHGETIQQINSALAEVLIQACSKN